MSQPTDEGGGLPVEDLLGEAITAYHPPRAYDPDDITTWSAEQLDELAVLAIADQPGMEVDYLGAGQHDAPHGVNTPEEQV
jgi:hypothetical protein